MVEYYGIIYFILPLTHSSGPDIVFVEVVMDLIFLIAVTVPLLIAVGWAGGGEG
jgi:hypothetical protein